MSDSKRGEKLNTSQSHDHHTGMFREFKVSLMAPWVKPIQFSCISTQADKKILVRLRHVLCAATV